MAVDWNLTCIQGVLGPWGHIQYSCEDFCKLISEKEDLFIKHLVDF